MNGHFVKLCAAHGLTGCAKAGQSEVKGVYCGSLIQRPLF